MKEKLGEPQFPNEKNGPWQYYVDSYFAWIPTYCQGSLCWFQRVWFTWPEDKNGKLIMASDVLSKEDMASMMNRDSEMYRTYYPYDPRTKGIDRVGPAKQ